MQNVASEMNLSETAFCWLLPEDLGLQQPASHYGIRFFTPTQEVPLCGHATLASAFAILKFQADSKNIGLKEVTFHAAGGILICRLGEGQSIVMDFPAALPNEVPVLEAYSRIAGQPILEAARRGDWLVLRLETPEAVRGANPDLASLVKEGHGHLILTAEGGNGDFVGYDMVSRVFAPGAGIPEDPVTGFAHTLLAPFWAAKLGKANLNCFQVSRRGGSLQAHLVGDRVHLSGEAVLVFEIQLASPALP